MSWRDKLRPAKFRGIPFEVTGDSGTGGRRNSIHEYPFRDVPWAYDMGRKRKTWRLEAFVIGSDYLDKRDRLIEALDKEGIGELVHPWYGNLNVIVEGDYTVDHSTDKGGMAVFSILFGEAGENKFPSESKNYKNISSQKLSEFDAAVRTSFTTIYNISRLPAFVEQTAIESIQTVTGLLPDLEIARDAEKVFEFIKAADKFIGIPIDLVNKYSSKGRLQIVANQKSLNALTEQLILSSKSKSILTKEYTDSKSILIDRAEAITLFDAAMDNAEDTLFDKAVNLKTALLNYIDESKLDLPNVREVKTNLEMPWLTVVHKEDTNEADFLNRNNITHPLFAPTRLEILNAS